MLTEKPKPGIGLLWQKEVEHVEKFLRDLRMKSPQSRQDYIEGMETMFAIMCEKFWNARNQFEGNEYRLPKSRAEIEGRD